VTPRILEHAEATGRVVRLRHGVYVAAPIPTDPSELHLQRALAHQLRRPGHVASHTTAALVWGLPLDDVAAAADGPVRFTVPAGPLARARRSAEAVAAVRSLPREARAMHPSGLVVTTEARTAVDLTMEADLPAALVTLDAVARRVLISAHGEARVRHASQRQRNVDAALRPLHGALDTVGLRGRAAAARGVNLADPRRESPAESLSFGHMVLAGLPLPEVQVRLTDDQGEMYPDFLWRRAMLIGEVDGAVKYSSREDLIAERRREARLRALGWRVVRWEAVEIWRQPHRVMRRIWSDLGEQASA
jgi:very-short-patch-repair endonuclease